VITDVNVSLSQWPGRRVPGDETPDLLSRLRKRGVTQAWAGTFDAILHKDLAAANTRLADECRRYGTDFFVPMGAVNPLLPNWKEDLRRCRQEHGMPGIRLLPGYHGYLLTDAVFAELLHEAARLRLLVQIAVSLEDTRTQNRLLRAQPADLTNFARVAAAEPSARIVLLNWPRGLGEGQNAAALARSGSVYFDIAMVEGIECIARLVEQLPGDRVLFGSHAPFFTFDSALLKTRESGLSEARLEPLLYKNAASLL
jgi:hypothetical protein